MTLSTRVESYFVAYASGANRKRIDLINSTGVTFAYLNFVPDGTTWPADSIIDGKKHLFYRLSDFANCLDLLRNEDPIYLRWDGTTAGSINSLNTSVETVGDGEVEPAT